MNKLIYKYSFSILMVLITLGQTLAQERQIVDKIIARVGGEVVLMSDVETFVSQQAKNNNTNDKDTRCQIMESILLQKLLINQAKLDSVEVKDEEVESQLQARIDQILSYMGGDISKFEAYYGKTTAQVKEEYRQDIKDKLLMDRMQAKLQEDVKVTPSEVKAFFSQIKVDSLPYFNSEVELGEIVMKPSVNKTESEKSKKKLEDIRKRIIDDKEDFATLAKKYSDDEGSGAQGGDLGWQKRGTFVSEFEAVAYNLQENEISPVFQTEFGFHIIQMLDRRGNNIHLRHILIKPTITPEDLLLVQNKLDSVRTMIVDKKLTFEDAVKKYSDKNAYSYNNAGRMLNPHSRNNIFETADLESDVYFTLDSMEVNGISHPIAYKMDNGDRAFRLIKLISRTKPHKANLNFDYSRIKNVVVENKKDQFLLDWVTEKVKSVFVSVDPYYQTCPNLSNWVKENQ